MSQDRSISRQHLPQAIEPSLRLYFHPDSSVHIPQRPSMKHPPISKHPLTTPHSRPRLELAKSTLSPHRAIQQHHKLPKRPRPQTTDQPIERVQRRQHRHAIHQDKMQQIVRKPKDRHQIEQEEFQTHQQTAPDTSLLQFENNHRIACLQRALQNSQRPFVVEMVEGEAECSQDFAAVVLVPGFQCDFFVSGRAGTDSRKRRVRRIYGVRNEGQIRGARGGFEPGVDVGI
jgi:hypothetical protein